MLAMVAACCRPVQVRRGRIRLPGGPPGLHQPLYQGVHAERPPAGRRVPGQYADGMTGTQVRPAAVELLRHLRAARDHIDRHYARPLDLDELARVAAVSKFHLVRSFEAAYGVT